MQNKLITFAFITAVAIIAAIFFAELRAPQSTKEKAAFFPNLAERIETVNKISITGYAEEINLVRDGNRWVIDEFDGYPALADKVKRTVLGVADLKINAPKTTLPRLYHRLGVEGPTFEDSSSLLLELEFTQNESLAVIVGKPRRSSAAQNSPGLYVRKPGSERSYLVDGVLEISPIKTDWIERQLFDIPAEAVRSVRIDHYDGDTFTLIKSDQGQENFTLENLPPGKKIASGLIINRFGAILQDMQISGAQSKTSLDVGNELIRARISSFDGLIADITAFEIDAIPYAAFRFRFDESVDFSEENKEKAEQVRQYADELSSRTEGWWFEIPGFKYDALKKRSDVVMRDE